MPISEIIFFVILFVSLYLQVFFMVTFFENRTSLKVPPVKKNELKRYPATTIIVPCWNEEETLATTVNSLLALDYPEDKLHIFIIDDGSTDRTLEIAREFEKHPRISVFTKENGGKYTALNLGLSHVSTELVGCLDADSYVEKGALLEIAKIFENPEVKAVTPAIKISSPESIIQFIQKAEYNISVYLRKMFSLVNGVQVTPGPFSIFRKSVFDDLGGYRRAHNTEDMEMALRLHANHYRIENAHHAFVFTKGPRTFRALHKQRVRWVYGYLMNILDYRKLLFNPRYGNIGIVILPAGLFAIASAFYFMFIIAKNIINTISDKVLQIETVGWQLSFRFGHFDWFSISTQWEAFLSLFLILSTLFIAFLGKKMAEDSWKPSLDIVLFVLFYGYIAFAWISRAVYNTAWARGKESWR
ncbi:MAG TPA: glycosyltransferase [Candidatus Paceibacterota bacterium]|nr:glycosyltransferase [Candidatus Paceibacterota bacterium]